MWEYLVEKTTNAWAVNTQPFRDKLNGLGAEGWELVAIDQFGNLFFKRPKKLRPVA
jgi:hypothetical protein